MHNIASSLDHASFALIPPCRPAPTYFSLLLPHCIYKTRLFTLILFMKLFQAIFIKRSVTRPSLLTRSFNSVWRTARALARDDSYNWSLLFFFQLSWLLLPWRTKPRIPASSVCATQAAHGRRGLGEVSMKSRRNNCRCLFVGVFPITQFSGLLAYS